MKLARTKITIGSRRAFALLLLGAIALVVAGCGLSLPFSGQLPVKIPGVPSDLADIQGLMGELGIPDIGLLANVPGLEALTGLETPPGSISFQGPLELGLATGESITGTDIRFVQIDSEASDASGAGVAHFEIAGLRAPRQLGDSLDYDGPWPGITGVTYHLRLRVYQIGDGEVRAAGVEQLVIENSAPQAANVNLDSGGHQLRFPVTATSKAGAIFPGMTLGYGGQEDRGAILQGMPAGEYPYRKLGDSVEWSGLLTPNIPVVYHLRLLYYQEANATLGGVVIVLLPGS